MSQKSLLKFLSVFMLISMMIGMVAPLGVQASDVALKTLVSAIQKSSVDVDPALLAAIEEEGSANFFVVMSEKADLSAAFEIKDWSERGWYVYDTLREVADRTQAPIIEYAKKQGLEYRSFFTINSVYIVSGGTKAVQDMATFSGVELLRLEGEAYIQPAAEIAPLYGPMQDNGIQAYGWNLDTLNPGGSQYGMQAAQVWSQYGITGDGIVVANIDTGAYYQHEALDRQYRGNTTGNIGGPYDHDYDWYMPTSGCGDGTYACDNNGHGSGTIGIMAGETEDMSEQIGVAPGSQWIACKGCESNSCSEAALTGCADWMVAPTRTDGTDANPNMRPHVINNSWGGGSGDTWYQSYIQAWVAAGMFPAFSAGNSSGCSVLGSPGDNPEAFGTAAHGSTGGNLYAGGPSSFFPTPSCDPDAHEIDPHLNAPTFGRTANNSAGAYYNLSGTSGASPHTAGAVALMWAASPALIGDIDTTFTLLEQFTNHDVPAGVCGKPACAGANDWPNYEYGWGYLDALAAVNEAQSYGSVGTLTGQVTEATLLAAPGDPLTGATIAATLSPTQTWSTATDASGIYTMTLITGTYDVSASAFGYLPATVNNVDIVSGTITVQDFALSLAPSHAVDGYVTDATTGWPLYASLDIDGYPGDAIWTDPATGYYSISLPAGITYTFDVAAWVPGYLPDSRDVGPLTGDVTEDFALDADASSCTAPGYDLNVTGIFEDFEGGTFPPTGWTVVNNGGTCDWVGNDPGGRGNLTGATGDFAIADSDDCGSGTTMDTTMYSPIVDVSALPTLVLEFNYDYYDASWAADGFEVDVSADGGSTWTNIATWTSNDRGPALFSQDVTTELGGSTQAQVRFRYYAPGWDWWVEVDDVFMGVASCDPPADGGLVVGNVYDDNTLDALNGAMVDNEDGYTAEAVETPFDANVDDGFYTLFSPSGSKTFTATMSGYNPDVQTPTVVNGDTIGQDFYLGAGMLDADPDNLHVTLDMGDSVSVTLDLDNLGSAAADFELQEADGGFMPALQNLNYTLPSATPTEIVRLSDGSVDCAAYENYIFAEPAEVAAACSNADLAASTANSPTAPTDMGYAQDIGYISDNFVNFVLNDFPGQTVVGTQTDAYYGMDFDPSGTILYALNDTTGQLGTIDLTTGAFTGLVPCAHPSGIWTGLSIASDGTFYASDATSLYTIDPATGNYTLIGAFGPTLMIDIAVNANGEMYGHDIGTDSIYQIDPATGVATLIGLTNYNANYAQGMDFDFDDGMLYIFLYIGSGANVFGTVDLATGAVTPLATDNPTGEFEGAIQVAGSGDAVPWLSEDPITGTVSAAGTQIIDVTFDAGVPEVTQPGDYHATLKVNNDTPYGTLDVPVIMTVNAPTTWGKLEGTVTGLGYCDADPTALEDAEVFITDSGGMTYTLMTDANGYFSRWFDESGSSFTIAVDAGAEHETGYAAGVVVSGSMTTTVDFDLRWLQPCVSVAPDSLEATLDMGDSTVLTLDIDNTGSVSTTFEIVEKPGGYDPLMLGAANIEITPRERLAGYDDNAMSTEGILSAGGTQPVNILAAGDVLAQWATGHTLNWGDGFDLDAGTVWINDNAAGGGTGLNEEFDVAGTLTGANFTPNFGGSWPGDMAYNPNSGMFWQVNVGGDNCLYEWDPSIPAATGNTICSTAWATSQRGVAYDAVGDTYFVGGWNDDTVWHIDGSGTLIDSWGFAGGISGLAYNFEAGLLFIQENSSTDAITVVDVATWTIVDSFAAAGFGSNAGAGLAIDCDGNLWAPNQGDNNAYLIDSGVPASLCGADVPWLSEDPITGTLAADVGAQTIDVTFDAGVPEVTQPGTYYAALNVKSDDPYNSPLGIPVTMTVNAPATWGKLEGTVTGLGYCDADPAPLEDAEVFITDSGGMTYTLMTDANGYYSQWFDEADSPFTLAVSAVEHEAGYAAGVVVSGSMTTTVDFDLRWLQPCVSADPAALEVTLLQGYSTTLALDIDNAGAVSTTFELQEKPGGYAAPLHAPSSMAPFSSGAAPANLLQYAQSNVAYEGPIVKPNVLAQNILIDQPPNQINGLFSDSGCDICGSGQQSIADNFVLTDEATIGQVILWSGYYPTDVPIDPDLITVIFHVDAGGSPGAAVSTESNVPYDRVQTGVILFGVHEWLHTLTLVNPVTLGPGTYWVEIYNETGFGTDDFFWETGDLDAVNGLAGSAWATTVPGSGWNLDSGTDLAFQLITAEGEIPWLSEDPITGTVNADDVYTIDVTFDTMTYTLGTYTGTLMVKSDDPVNGTVEVPVTMHVIDMVYGVDMSGDDAQSGDPGDVVTYTLSVTNTGNVADTFGIVISDTWGASAPASIMLNAGATGTFDVLVPIPAGAMGGDFDVAAVSVTSVGDPTESDSADLTTTANTTYGVELSGDDAMSGDPGDVVTYTLSITNTGNAVDTFTIAISDTWGATAPASIMLNAGATGTFDAAVTVPAGAMSGDFDVAAVTVTSAGDPTESDSADLTTTANTTYGVELSGDDAMSGDPGDVVTYTLSVTNTGNAVDIFDIAISDTWNATAPASIMLAAGATGTFDVAVPVPAGAADGDLDVAAVTVTSVNDALATDNADLTTTAVVTEYLIYLPLLVK